MRIMLFSRLSAFGAFILVILAACGGSGVTPPVPGPPPPPPPPPPNPTVVTQIGGLRPGMVAVGGDIPRIARTENFAGIELPGNAITWTSDNPGIASVSATGVVHGVASGTATIRASGADKVASVLMTIHTPHFTSIAPGGRHVCALEQGGGLLCWGNNLTGVLGVVSNSERCIEPGECSYTPQRSVVGPAFNSVASGEGHSCGLTSSGDAYCWGRNETGQLGAASTEQCVDFVCSHTPLLVGGGLKFVQISPGGLHTCGLVASGTAYCWGGNDVLQIGAPAGPGSLSPVPVPGGLLFSTLAVGSGASHSCGLTSAGAAYCWGWNATGQLGSIGPDTNIPRPVTGGFAFTALSTYRDHTCGLTEAGAAYCWGLNDFGQLGNGTTTNSSMPTPVLGGPYSSLAVGLAHTCARSLGGLGICWGQNLVGTGISGGQLGAGDLGFYSAVPVQVSRGIAFTELRSGRLYSCGRTADGRVYCWGDNRFGQLGNGEEGVYNRTAPVGVAGIP